jgi:hypothetical protein
MGFYLEKGIYIMILLWVTFSPKTAPVIEKTTSKEEITMTAIINEFLIYFYF